METVHTQDIKQRPKELWQKQCDHLRSAAKFTSIAQRILIFGLIATLIGIVVGHFTFLPNFHLRWPVIFFIVAWVGVEILWKCLCAYFVGAALAGWMKKRSALVNVCCHLTNLTDALQAFTVGKTDLWIKPFREIANSIPGEVQKIRGGVNDLDEAFSRLEDAIASGPFLAVGSSEALSRLPKIWEGFSSILPCRLRREAFDPPFNDMLEGYMRAQKFLGKSAKRWLAFGFTICAALVVLDCIRVMLTSGASRFLLGILPESFRAWWRRH